MREGTYITSKVGGHVTEHKRSFVLPVRSSLGRSRNRAIGISSGSWPSRSRDISGRTNRWIKVGRCSGNGTSVESSFPRFFFVSSCAPRFSHFSSLHLPLIAASFRFAGESRIKRLASGGQSQEFPKSVRRRLKFSF